MSATLISEWRVLRRGRPGHRFRDRYETSRKNRERTVLGRVVRLIVAVIALIVGIVLVFIPGPAILFFIVAGSLLAAESKQVAKALDATEVQIRKVISWLAALWRKLPFGGKVAAVLLGAIVTAGLVHLAYRFWISR